MRWIAMTQRAPSKAPCCHAIGRHPANAASRTIEACFYADDARLVITRRHRMAIAGRAAARLGSTARAAGAGATFAPACSRTSARARGGSDLDSGRGRAAAIVPEPRGRDHAATRALDRRHPARARHRPAAVPGLARGACGACARAARDPRASGRHRRQPRRAARTHADPRDQRRGAGCDRAGRRGARADDLPRDPPDRHHAAGLGRRARPDRRHRRQACVRQPHRRPADRAWRSRSGSTTW